MEHSSFIGIDVAKDHLDVHIRPTGEAWRVNYDDAGLATLLARLRSLTPTVIVLEATLGQLAKTDTLDARVIALFAEAVRPAARPVPDEQAQALGELIARRRQLVDMLGAEQNRRRLLRDRRLLRHLEAHIAWLEEALRRLDHDLSFATTPAAKWLIVSHPASDGATPRALSGFRGRQQ